MKKKSLPGLLTITEVSQMLKAHPNTLRKWDKKGILKAVRIGQRRDRRYRKEDIMRLVSGRDQIKEL